MSYYTWTVSADLCTYSMSLQKGLKQSVATPFFRVWGSGRHPTNSAPASSTPASSSTFHFIFQARSIYLTTLFPHPDKQQQHLTPPSQPLQIEKREKKMQSAYTPTQLSHYLTRISLPNPPSPPRLDLPFLTALHTHQLCTVPYENLSLHYSPDHTVRLDPQHLYRKLVTGGRGRGGYCMEIAVFFNHILRALGFEVYTAGARVRPVCVSRSLFSCLFFFFFWDKI